MNMEGLPHFCSELSEEQPTGQNTSSTHNKIFCHRHQRTVRQHQNHHRKPGSSFAVTSTISHTSQKMLLVSILLFVLASGVSSGALPERELPRPERKVYSVERLHNMLKELFKKQKMELWGRMFDERSGRGGGGGGVGDGGKASEDQGRYPRAAGDGVVEAEEERVFTMEEEDNLYTFVGEVMACQNIPGLSLGVVKKGVRQGLGYGVADMETARPVDGDTLFGIGSNSKAFAAATMARLMFMVPPDVRFSFGTPLAQVLEDFKLPDETLTTMTTLEDVLSHRTGLASADIGIFAGYPANMTTKDMCQRLQFLPTIVPFRSAWYYSNTLLVLVSHLCETLAGKTWETLLEETILQPLEMNNTTMTVDAMSHDNVALPYILRMRVDDMFVQQDNQLFNIHPLEAAGAIMSSANDMTKWMAYLLDVLKRPSGYQMTILRSLFTDKIIMPAYLRQAAPAVTPEPILPIGYAMGFITSYYKGLTLHWHSGDLHGYNSYMVLVPELDVAVYVAINGPSGASTSVTVLHLTYYVLELLQGQAPWVNMTLACPEMPEAMIDPDEYDYDYPGDDTQVIHPDAQKLLRPIEDYLGVFGNGLLDDLVIAREEERNSLLRLELGRYMVADLIPTERAEVFKMIARPPLADTKEWEKEHNLIFRSSTSGSKRSKRQAASGGDSKNGTIEEVEKPPFDEVHIRWKLERFTFKKGFHFDPTEQEEGGGEGEKEEEEESENSEASSQVCDNGAVTLFDNYCYRVVVLSLLAFVASLVQLY